MNSNEENTGNLELYKYIYDEILDISEDGFLVVDSDGIIIDINNTYCKFLKTTRENAIGIHVLDLIPNSKMADMVKGGVREHNVIHTFNADQNINGDNFVWVTSKSPVKKNGKIVAAVAQIKFKQQTINLARKIKSQDCQLQYYKEEVKRLGAGKYSFATMIGNCHLFLKAKSLAIKSAKSDFPVLLTGETGTGKEVFSNSIHYSSDRANYPMVRINCAAIPSELLESELFGYEDGAFTGAKKGGRKGKFELANKGTIFLDEIGDMPLHMQSKLLRVLQEKEIERIGGNKNIQVDVRIIAATHQNIRKMVDVGKFREDLFYRLNVINITIPPLRERKDDIIHFANSFLRDLNKKYKKEVSISEDAVQCLLSHKWPGNIRELKNIIEGAFAISDDNTIDLTHLPSNIVTKSNISLSISKNKKYNELMDDYEKHLILDCLNRNKNNCNQTAKELGIHRSTLYKKLDKLGIEIDRH